LGWFTAMAMAEGVWLRTNRWVAGWMGGHADCCLDPSQPLAEGGGVPHTSGNVQRTQGCPPPVLPVVQPGTSPGLLSARGAGEG